MNIDNLSEGLRSQAARKAVGIDTISRRPVVERDPVTSGDQVDMSMIGKLMARSVRMLADSEGVRPEVLAKHQQLPKQNARFDDKTLDRIFYRMQGS